MTGRFDRPGQRAGRLLAGLVLFGLAMALLLEARAGLDPWNVLHQGVARGSVGVATVAFAIAIGPLVHRALPWLAVDGPQARGGGDGYRPLPCAPPSCTPSASR